MDMTVQDVLLLALEDLDEKSFKRFCGKIMDIKIEEGYNKIAKSKLEKAERCDVVDLILRQYTDSYGPELTIEVLNAINEKKVALGLKKNLENVDGFCWREKPKEPQGIPDGEQSRGAESKPKTTGKPREIQGHNSDEEHFVDKYREELIQGVYLVDPILDGLLQKPLLITEQYDKVRSQTTSQDKMRELYMCIRGWGPDDKDILYEILLRNNRPLIEKLKRC
ncbi:apoptosis-associated speck-like protein containing a CARD isoform X2 [Pyxicephalus adspersus]|uniref:apoptosis-associated speck-like protein containing a CARD isoform X2 n=1 Tax=Pyxicephalus adspersus TaxID=30357 RepID=UPI003B5CC9E4